MIKYVSLFLLLTVLNVATGFQNLPEGSPCRADGYPGTCRHWKSCLTLLVDQQDHKYPPLCSFAGVEPVVCCTSCILVEDVSKIVINPRGLFLWKTDQKSWNRCIDYYLDLPYQLKDTQKGSVSKSWNATRGCHRIQVSIIAAAGGRDANRAEFPHMALLGYTNNLVNNIQWLCGGTVLSEKFILTAGHCISSPSVGPVTYAALGILKRSDPEDLWQKYMIESIIPHSMYQPPSKYHDIALLKTMQRYVFKMKNKNSTDYILQSKRDASVSPKLDEDANDETATATGWGTVGTHTQPADTLQVVDVQKFNKAKCSTLYGVHRLLKQGYQHDTQMCYGDMHQVKDTCMGDSGGPLQIRGQVFYEQRTIIGVTSYGPDCGYPGQGGMYTRVRYYIPWIENIVWA